MSTARRSAVKAVEAVVIAAAIALQVVPLPAGWIEDTYANGIYARLARTFVPLANGTAFAIGDAILCAVAASVVAVWIADWRRGGSRRARAGWLALHTAAIGAAIVIWFDAAWALNYRRAPIVQRVAFDAARLNPHDVAAFSAAVVDGLNATAPLAHAERISDEDLRGSIATAFGPVVRRLGDRYDVIVSRPKRTLFNWWFALAGIGGEWDPFAYETIVNADFLPFERPFTIAHEWGHVAGFGDESDANLIAALTTLRSKDPLVRYSGLFWAYGFLPHTAEAKRITPLVRADFIAAARRYRRDLSPQLSAVQWFLYDKYLRANRVTAGVASYSLFVQVLVGTPLDRDGLPLMRTAPRPAAAQDAAHSP